MDLQLTHEKYIEDLDIEFNLSCSSCCEIKPTFSCPLCSFQQCYDCIKDYIHINLSTQQVENISHSQFPCINCGHNNNFDDSLFDPSAVAIIATTILQRKHTITLLENNKRHQDEINNSQSSSIEFYKKKFFRLTNMFSPCCAMAFNDFEACAAIHCDFCHKNFCALCLEFVIDGTTHDDLIDLDKYQKVSLHQHVRLCKFNIHFKGDHYVKQWYPNYCQASRFAFQWNLFASDDIPDDVFTQVYDFITPFTKDSHISFNHPKKCVAIISEEQAQQLNKNKIHQKKKKRDNNKKKILCSFCGDLGYHNKKTCPKRLLNIPI